MYLPAARFKRGIMKIRIRKTRLKLPELRRNIRQHRVHSPIVLKTYAVRRPDSVVVGMAQVTRTPLPP